MNIHSLRIEGFRKHKDTTILFSDSTFLIGENNVGKSSVLVALDYLLNSLKYRKRNFILLLMQTVVL